METSLTVFKPQYSKWLPFFEMPSITTWQTFAEERPALLLSIWATSSKVPSQRRALGDLFRRKIAESMAVESRIHLIFSSVYSSSSIGKFSLTIKVRDRHQQDLYLARYHVHSKDAEGSQHASPIWLILDFPESRRKASTSAVEPAGLLEEKRIFLGCFMVILRYVQPSSC